MGNFTFKSKTVVLLLSTLFTGLLAGVFFTWTNAITPGIGRLNDVSYLQVFQYMNRTILNPLFFLVIIGPLFLSPLAAFLYQSSHRMVFWSIAGASIIYYIGVFVVTMWGNIPLNELLDNTQLADINLEEAKKFRELYEAKWNRLHLIRTISSSTSFVLLIWACLFSNGNGIKNFQSLK